MTTQDPHAAATRDDVTLRADASTRDEGSTSADAVTRTERPAVAVPPLVPLKKHPGLVAACAAAGLALGLGAAALTPTTYTAEARMAVGSGTLNDLTIPGYPTASADLAANYARWVTAQGAGGEVIPEEADVTLSASPLPSSNVILVEAESGDPDLAVRTADAAATALRDEVNTVREADDPDRVLAQITEHAPELAIAEEKANVMAGAFRDAYDLAIEGQLTEADTQVWQDGLAEAEARYQTLDAEQNGRISRYNRLISQNTTEADLSIVQPAAVAGDDAASNFQRFGLVGLVLGAVAGFVAAHLAYRRRTR